MASAAISGVIMRSGSPVSTRLSRALRSTERAFALMHLRGMALCARLSTPELSRKNGTRFGPRSYEP